MPGRFQNFVFNFSLQIFNDLPILRLQTDYVHELTLFKPDKKLKWCTVQLELQLEDRVVDVAPPLEAYFIELFSE